MSSITGDYSKYNPFIGPLGEKPKYIQIGNGWSTTFKIIPGVLEGYSFAILGIDEFIKVKQIQAKVCDTSMSLNEELQKLEPNQSMTFVIRSSALDLSNKHYREDQVHVISLFAQRREDRLLLFINDSNGVDYPYDDVRKTLKLPCELQLFVSEVKRQLEGNTCQTFAIRDCKQFNKDPKLIDTLLELNGYVDAQGSQSFPIRKLPESLLLTKEKIKIKAKIYLDAFVKHLTTI